jgi:hypothetical protein
MGNNDPCHKVWRQQGIVKLIAFAPTIEAIDAYRWLSGW